ncbi:SusD/RagB family nutrient-binding outer membrane lipoprotein [Pedobacter metabolipauper]|uniref:SusD-like starch-binding protein associating with outer membrane n=1 Tax=Pedobacter metabolipauper TaxID=425513 RepID=A0A4V3D191_9SPHI|nr:SusD/RagB family nutrient-binding outer membrane lipoprotein [Pedobacter metabolipauper]TDQ09747.1 SusD-like starch-binding protein associating with outer membrane [Pedobacter metabolipauper]
MKYIKITFLIAILFIAGGCKKWLDVNTDPATPQVAKAELFLSPIISQMGINTATDGYVVAKYNQNMMAQAVTDGALLWERHGYASASDVGGNLWRMVYISSGTNLENMIKDAERDNKWTYAGIGYAIKAWGFQLLTDQHGPVILDEAFTPNKLTFKYQDQPEVYARVREWCQKAIVCLNTPDGADYSSILSGASGDLIYRGDRAKWKKFVYGLLAQQYSHLINKQEFAGSYADSVVKYSDLSFSASADDATIMYGGNTAYVSATNTGDSNPLSQNFGQITSTSYGRIGQPVVDLLTGGVRGTPAVDPKTSVDPRLSRMINPIATTGIYKGVTVLLGDNPTIKTIPHVLGSVAGTAAAPFPGKYIFANAARYPIMSYAQIQFAKAEALFIKGNLADAYTAYKNGITGHMEFVNLYGRNGTPASTAISAAEITAYMASAEVAQNAGSLTIADIMQQKYIAQWGWAQSEQWCDLRKYHYDATVFKTYKQLETGDFYVRNGGAHYAYRIRPRYNSEYIWNYEELLKWGGIADNYHTIETWFTLP